MTSSVAHLRGRGTPGLLSDACRDLVLGSACVGCGHPGRVLCADCARALPTDGRTCWPTPPPAGLALPTAAAPYDGRLKEMINAHKERRAFALTGPLGGVLAGAVRSHVRTLESTSVAWSGGGPVLLVPVPSAPSVVRARGHDPLLRVSREAARRLRRESDLPVRVLAALRAVGGRHDQTGLGAEARAANLRHAFCCRDRVLAGWVERGGLVLVVDDVLATGATAREAQRAVEQTGARVDGVVTLTATRRRGQARPSSETSRA